MYQLALGMGADVIEQDLFPTRGGHLVRRHENDITGTTDVAGQPEFAHRRTTGTVDGTRLTGWFTEDFDHPDTALPVAEGFCRKRPRGPVAAPGRRASADPRSWESHRGVRG